MFLRSIQEYFNPASILDVGANTGWFYELAKTEFPTANFYLIEANPMCEESIKNKNVEYYMGALSDCVKTVSFYTNVKDPWTTGASIYRENTHHFSDEELVVNEYETTTLDILFPHRSFDLIKMDVQGSELDIIRGGLTVVSKCKGLLLEVSKIAYNHGAPLEDEVVDYLKTIGFYEEEELACHYNVNHELSQRDVLFINKNL